MAGESFFINDGNTRHFRIAARPGIHPELEGEYRPAHPDVRTALQHPNMGADVYAARAVQIVAKQVKSWNAGVDIKPETVRELEPNLFRDLLDYVLGYTYAEAGEKEKNSDAG